MSVRLYKWTQISGWPIEAARKAGELRAICAHPYCDRTASFGRVVDRDMRLWVIAKRMRCRGCGHLGAQFEVWGPARN